MKSDRTKPEEILREALDTFAALHPSLYLQRERGAALDALIAERDAYRIEADCAMRDYDALELRFGRLTDAVARGNRPVRDYSGMGF